MKYRNQKQASSLKEILSFLSNSPANVWVGKDYSLSQLILDLKTLDESENIIDNFISSQTQLDNEMQKILFDNIHELYER